MCLDATHAHSDQVPGFASLYPLAITLMIGEYAGLAVGTNAEFPSS